MTPENAILLVTKNTKAFNVATTGPKYWQAQKASMFFARGIYINTHSIYFSDGGRRMSLPLDKVKVFITTRAANSRGT